jgi:hypothetical protein
LLSNHTSTNMIFNHRTPGDPSRRLLTNRSYSSVHLRRPEVLFKLASTLYRAMGRKSAIQALQCASKPQAASLVQIQKDGGCIAMVATRYWPSSAAACRGQAPRAGISHISTACTEAWLKVRLLVVSGTHRCLSRLAWKLMA